MDLYEKVFRSTYQFIGILDPEGRLLDANDTALNFINKTKASVVGRFFWETEWWSHDPELQETLKLALETLRIKKIPQRFEVTHPRHDEHISAFDFSLSPLLDDMGQLSYIIAEGRDVSAIKEAERDREISEIRYKDLFVNSGDAYLIIDEDRFIEFNPATVKMLGFKNEAELLGVHPSALSPEYQPDGRLSYEKADELMRQAYANGTSRFEWMHQKKDGTVFPVEVLLTPIRQGDRTLLFTVWRDVTLQKANEAQIVQMNLLVESKKLAALGQLIIGISHEMNTPIGTAITGVSYLEHLVKELQADLKTAAMDHQNPALDTLEDVIELTHQVNRSLQHAANLVSHFKSLAITPSEDSLGDVTLYELIKEAARPFSNEMVRYNHTLHIRVPKDFKIETHALTLSNVMTQLISNALFHGFEGRNEGEMVVDLKIEPNQIQLIFSDNGSGLKQEDLDRIFEPFFTTHRGTGKSGLGMNIVYNQVHQILHGQIAVQNNATDSGCQITLTLPRQ